MHMQEMGMDLANRLAVAKHRVYLTGSNYYWATGANVNQTIILMRTDVCAVIMTAINEAKCEENGYIYMSSQPQDLLALVASCLWISL